MMESPSIGGGVTERVLDRYNEKENPNGNFPALGNRSYNTLPSSFWIANGAYCRMKNLELGYTIPSKLLSKAKIQLLRFYISAQNLFTITNFKNYDPEKYASDSQNCTYPNAKTFSLGINLNF